MRPLRREMQVVFQDPYGSLSPRMSVAEIVEEGLIARSKMSPAERRRVAERALADTGTSLVGDPRREGRLERRKRRRHAVRVFLFGLFVGIAGLVAAALLLGPRP